MNVNIESYRQRIGLFGSGRGFSGRKCKNEYSPYNTWKSDIHERALLICLFMCSTLLTSHILVIHIMSTANISDRIISNNCCYSLSLENCHSKMCPINSGETGKQLTFSSYYSMVLSLSSDIETNPGPLTDKEEILNAIVNSSKELKLEIQSVKFDITGIKTEMANKSKTCSELKNMTSVLQKNQQQIEKRLGKAESTLKDAVENQENIQLDVDAVQTNVEDTSVRVNLIEDRVEQMEKQSIKFNMRVFGLTEVLNEHEDGVLKDNVIANVLSVASPTAEWSTTNITDTYRIGKSINDQPKVTIIKFANFSDKVNVFKC